MTARIENSSRRDPFTLVLLVASLALAALVVVLAWQNWTMKRRLAQLHPPATEEGLSPGDRVAPFDVLDPTGSAVRIEFGDDLPSTLLLVFSTTCPACERNMPAWRELLGRPLPASLRVVGIQTDLAAGATADPSLPFAVFTMDRSRGARLDGIPYVPATVLLDPRGQVIAAWFDVLGDSEQADLACRLSSD